MNSDLDQRERWNEKYRTSPESWVEPDAFLPWAFRKFIQPAFPNAGRVLDVAGGAGRHALWLAQQGWDVTLIDISETEGTSPLSLTPNFSWVSSSRYRP